VGRTRPTPLPTPRLRQLAGVGACQIELPWRLLRAPFGITMMLYHYFRKFDGNVCMDWRLTSDLSTSFQTTDGKTARVNSQAFEQFLNPNFKGSEAGSCQEAGPRLFVLLRPRLAFRCTVSPLSALPPPRFARADGHFCVSGAGYEDKQLKFSAYVKPPAAAASLVQPIL
jgi:hypothetical protein